MAYMTFTYTSFADTVATWSLDKAIAERDSRLASKPLEAFDYADRDALRTIQARIVELGGKAW